MHNTISVYEVQLVGSVEAVEALCHERKPVPEVYRVTAFDSRTASIKALQLQADATHETFEVLSCIYLFDVFL